MRLHLDPASGQYDDLEGDAARIMLDRDDSGRTGDAAPGKSSASGEAGLATSKVRFDCGN